MQALSQLIELCNRKLVVSLEMEDIKAQPSQSSMQAGVWTVNPEILLPRYDSRQATPLCTAGQPCTARVPFSSEPHRCHL